ncbi:MAG: hypothetical protein DMG59_21205 [Acidobacteria bacterium]|nr:MAG: hypothetical protein DMG59_21205 [Acidobacteriota bacterium]
MPAPAGSMSHVERHLITTRERHVLAQRRAGRTLAQIAEELGVSKERVRQLEARAFEKLGADDDTHR